MLLELSVRDLGVIAELGLVMGEGMTAVTGETGAGKTLVVEALDLVVGGRADPTLVRPGAAEASVEARFLLDGDEVVLARVVPADGRSRAYVDGRMVPATALGELGARLVDLHGQHTHQSLLAPATQRAAVDQFGGVDHGPRRAARAAMDDIAGQLAQLGGDERSRAREIDLLRFQVAELAEAAVTDADEDARLEAEEAVLADASAHREAASAAYRVLADDGGAADGVASAVAALGDRAPFAAARERLDGLAAELREVGGDLRAAAERLDEDPERLAAVQARRQLLRDLRRKYGDTLGDVLAFAEEAGRRLAALESHAERAAALEREQARVEARLTDAEAAIAAGRRRAAPALGAAVQEHLRTLALGQARFEVAVDGPGPADVVTFLLGANPGEPALPLAKVASGGELARTMLAARLVLTRGPDTLVFDEVDAGVGGEAALAVGRALAALAPRHQVLVVTHLPQVAAFADHQVAVTKTERDGRTVASATPLDETGRVVELSRMLSGQPQSAAARGHAEELLAAAARERGR